VFVFIINLEAKKKKVFSNILHSFSVLVLAALSFFGTTVEVLDAKVNSDIFSKGTPEIILSAIYLLIAGSLLYKGRKDRDMIVNIAATAFAIYALYFISSKLLG
jgi:uncharacterized membrane protein YqaE (UPF0057 family)